LDLEKQAMREYFPAFRFQDQSSVIGPMSPNNGREYVLWMNLEDFPNKAPEVYIVSPKGLKGYDGRLLSEYGRSASMHLLDPDGHGHPQICHYNGQFWLPKVSVYKILLKTRFWLEAYEQHLRHGKPIDAYLPHMQ
jgi:hypothetical protein